MDGKNLLASAYTSFHAPVVCDPLCENGVCVANDTCNCAAGYQGERCTEQGRFCNWITYMFN